MNELDRCIKQIDEIMDQINDINYKLSMALVAEEAERIANEC